MKPATLIEPVVYYAVSRPHDAGRSLVASALANSFSYGAGFIVFRVIVP